MTKDQINDYLTDLESQLIQDADGVEIVLTRDWARQFPTNAGVYVIREDGDISYVGETGLIRARMTDLLDTRNHVIRRSIGNTNFADNDDFEKATARKKFSDNIESQLEDLMTSKLKVSVLAVDLGRKELEEMLYDKYKPKYNNKGKRSAKKSR